MAAVSVRPWWCRHCPRLRGLGMRALSGQQVVPSSPHPSPGPTATGDGGGFRRPTWPYHPAAGTVVHATGRVPIPLLVMPEFVTQEEHDALVAWVTPSLSRRRYEGAHWDHVIHRYRETQVLLEQAPPLVAGVVSRMVDLFPSGCVPQPHAHILDLAADGAIDFHVDSVKFSGRIVTGVSLLSPAIMRLRWQPAEHHPQATQAGEGGQGSITSRHPTEPAAPVVDLLLQPRSLYMLVDESRYDWGHAVLGGVYALPGGDGAIHRGRRISFILRDELLPTPPGSAGGLQ